MGRWWGSGQENFLFLVTGLPVMLAALCACAVFVGGSNRCLGGWWQCRRWSWDGGKSGRRLHPQWWRTWRGFNIEDRFFWGSTLRGGSLFTGLVMLVKRIVKSCNAWTWLSVHGAMGELAVGFVNAWTISWMPVMTRSVEEAKGIWTFVGNQERVSQMRSLHVSQIHTV